MFSRLQTWSIVFFTLFGMIFYHSDCVKPNYHTFDTADDSYKVEYLLQIPDTTSTTTTLNTIIHGIYFLAHGCNHQATDWFPRDDDCPDCLGLPIERKIVEKISNAGYITLAASSQNRDSRCWTRRDIEPIVRLINHTYYRIQASPETLPLYLLGASSGGAFVGLLGHYLLVHNRGFKASGLCAQIMNIMNGGLSGHAIFPPVVFIHMSERDSYTAKNIRDESLILKAYNISHRIYHAKPKPLTDDFFYINGGGLTEKESMVLVKMFRIRGVIDSNRMLVYDPRSSDQWRSAAVAALPTIFTSKDNLAADKSPVHELMNYAWAMHEITFEFVDEVIDWFASLPNLSHPETIY